MQDLERLHDGGIVWQQALSALTQQSYLLVRLFPCKVRLLHCVGHELHLVPRRHLHVARTESGHEGQD